MSESSFPFQGTSVADGPADFEEASGNRRTVLILAVVGILVLGALAYFFVFAGGDEPTDTSLPTRRSTGLAVHADPDPVGAARGQGPQAVQQGHRQGPVQAPGRAPGSRRRLQWHRRRRRRWRHGRHPGRWRRGRHHPARHQRWHHWRHQHRRQRRLVEAADGQGHLRHRGQLVRPRDGRRPRPTRWLSATCSAPTSRRCGSRTASAAASSTATSASTSARARPRRCSKRTTPRTRTGRPGHQGGPSGTSGPPHDDARARIAACCAG